MDVTGFQSLTRKKKMLELDNTHPSGIPVSRIVGLLVGIALLVATLILPAPGGMSEPAWKAAGLMFLLAAWWSTEAIPIPATSRSEEHTSELQSRPQLVCRLLLE